MKNSMNMMWGCVAVIAVVIILTVAGGSNYLPFALACAVMMGAMMWMMMGGSRGGDSGPTRHDD